MLNSFEDWLALTAVAQFSGRLLRTFSPVAIAGIFLFLVSAGLLTMVTSKPETRPQVCGAVLAFGLWFSFGVWI